MKHRCGWVVKIVLVCLALMTVRGGLASGPRWVTGRPFYSTDGQPVHWQQTNLLYYTDPGGLSASVNHAAADAIVAAAAGVWNVPVASITVGVGGALAEHVSSANVYLGPGGMVYPADVQKTNYAAVPIAIIYDTDGSVTDTLLGVGASAPSSCRQNGVTESVDQFDPAGYIQHAIIVMNGRCTGTASQLQLQMQYQLERVFGRVLGVAWSQTNDNVLMGAPTPTYNQALHWPIMHPIDIICGTYTYQCLPQPFVLRPDDVASMVLLYPVGSAAAGKQPSLQAAQGLDGSITFPSGMGMAGVNMLVRRESQGNVQEGWYESSAVSGALFRTNGVSPFVAADTSAIGSGGSGDTNIMGNYSFPYIPMIQTGSVWQNLVLSTEAVNPLYFGPYSLQPYRAGNVSPGGSTPAPKTALAYVGGPVPESFVIADAPTQCGTGTDGTAAAPVVAPATGWWNGQLCGQGHAAYVSLTVQPSRTLTVEVTALDEQGYATTSKAMPVIGIYAPTDGWNDLPSVAVAANAFQSVALGTTTLSTSTGSLTQLKVGIADQRGGGRPDFAYQARIFYADTVTPASLPLTGGTVTIAGMGFRMGNQVTVNGVAATVNGATANSISVTMPALFAVHAVSGAAVDVVVSDLSTGASSTMSGAMTYGPTAQPNIMKVVTAQAGTMYAGDTASVPFAVQIVAADGVTPVVGASVVFTTSAGAVTFGACGGATCTVATDANGLASTGVTATTAGAVTMVAASPQQHASALTQSASFTVLAQDTSLTTVSAPEHNLTVGTASQQTFTVKALTAGGATSQNRQITLAVTAGSAILSGCNASTCTLTTDYTGTVGANVTATAPGAIAVVATDGSLTQSVSMQATAVADIIRVASAPAATNQVNLYTSALTIQLLRGDGVTPDAYQNVIYSAPSGVQFAACGAVVCTLTTGQQGYAGSTIMASQAGTYAVQISFGSVTQTVPVTFTVPTPSMKLVTAPAGMQIVGSAANRPFTVQLLQADGVTPMTGGGVSFAAPAGNAYLAECGDRMGCVVGVDGNGMASATVVPLRAGPMTVTANFGTLNQSITVSAVGTTDTMVVLASPGAGTYTGDNEAFTVQVFGLDGVTPAAGKSVVFSVVSGAFTFSGCGTTSCAVVTDSNGKASASGVATAAGSVSVMAADGAITQTMTFSTTAKPDVMRMLSGPSGNVFSSYAAATAFAVQVLQPDGVTPAAGRTVTFAVSVGSVRFGACGGAPCSVTTDAMGRASTTVTPLAAGAMTVLAAESPVYVSDSFTAVLPDVMQVVSAPASGNYVGDVEGVAFALRVFAGDGATPAAGRSVALSVASGSAGFGACAGASVCTLVTDANGNVSSAVTPLAVGSITLSAADGPVTQTAAFTAVAKPDIVRIISAPASGSYVGDVAGVPFGVKVLLADGVAASTGKAVTVSVVGGAATLACGGTSCVLTSDAGGMVSTGVTPTAVGTVTLTAVEGSATQSVSFTAAAKPDVLMLLGGPADGTLEGDLAVGSFGVREVLADGVTASVGKVVTLAVVGGSAVLSACGGASCAVSTDAGGRASTGVTPMAAGQVRLMATNGLLQQSYTFMAGAKPDVMRVVSVPGNGAVAGLAAAPAFGVQVFTWDGMTPAVGVGVTMSVSSGTATLGACGSASCVVTTDGTGLASTGVTPKVEGTVGLLAVDGSVTQTASFTVVRVPDTMALVSAPTGSGYVGDAMPDSFGVRLVEADGTGDAGQSVTFSVTTGSALLGACGASTCVVLTDAMGMAKTSVTPLVPGAVTIAASAAAVSTGTQTASFMALRKPDGMSVVSAAGASVFEGATTAQVFSVRVLLADGVTPDVGVSVTFTGLGVAGGAVQFTACGAAACTVMTDGTGVAATGVLGVKAGAVTLVATADSSSGGKSVSVPLQVVANVYSLNATTGTLYVAAGANFATMVGATATLNGNPVAGLAVSWTAVNATLPSGNSSVTDALGGTLAQAVFSPLGTGQASVTGCAWTSQCATIGAVGVSADEFVLGVVSGGAQEVSGGAAVAPVTAVVMDAAGHPVAGAAVTVSQTVSALTAGCTGHGRCPTAPVLGTGSSVLITNAAGQVSVTPMSVAGTATETMLVLTAGTHGLANADVKIQP